VQLGLNICQINIINNKGVWVTTVVRVTADAQDVDLPLPHNLQLDT
jgi:hypothetical protein